MDSDPNETRVGLFCLSLPPFGKKRPRKTLVRPEGRTSPALPAKTLEPKLAEESAQVEKPEADEFVETKRKLEDEVWGLKKLLETREKDVADREATLERLQKDMSKIQTKVCRTESRTNPKS